MSQPPTSLSEARMEPLPEPTSAWRTGHDVQFYASERSLIASAGEFLREGLRAGQPLVIIATEAHRHAFIEEFTRHPEIRMDGLEITWLDAHATLASFMEGRLPNSERFRATIGAVFDKAMANRSYVVIRAYGEMVDLLWTEGNTTGALALEDLWNQFAAKYAFNLLCAYSMGHVLKESHVAFERICGCHGSVRRDIA